MFTVLYNKLLWSQSLTSGPTAFHHPLSWELLNSSGGQKSGAGTGLQVGTAHPPGTAAQQTLLGLAGGMY